MAKDNCALCRRNVADMTYAVDTGGKECRLCGACFGKWAPRVLDGLLGCKQADYGGEPASGPAKKEVAGG